MKNDEDLTSTSICVRRRKIDPQYTYNGVRGRRSVRVINKSGKRNVNFLNVPQISWKFFKDFALSMIEEQWRYVTTVFILSFILCWLVFAILWYMLAYFNGELDFDPITGQLLAIVETPCTMGSRSFTDFFLFSIELQGSTGYGEKCPTADCNVGMLLMVTQIIIGVGIEGAIIGIVYAKLSRAPKKPFFMNFSKWAVVCQRNSKLCLVFRVSDINQSYIVDSKIHAYWFVERQSLEGEKFSEMQYSLKLENDGRDLLIAPTTACHVIDDTSPFYNLSPQKMLKTRFEIVVILTGSSISTGHLTETTTSYLPREIKWGYRFVNMISYDSIKDTYGINYDRFDDIEEDETPMTSARQLNESEKSHHFHDEQRNGSSKTANELFVQNLKTETSYHSLYAAKERKNSFRRLSS